MGVDTIFKGGDSVTTGCRACETFLIFLECRQLIYAVFNLASALEVSIEHS